MGRMVKRDKNAAREKYEYFAYPKKLDRTLQAMIFEDAGKYGIENVKHLIRNILMEAIVHYEKTHRYIESREWAAENWQQERFSDMTATNLEEKMKTEQQKLKEKIQLSEAKKKEIEEEMQRLEDLLRKLEGENK
jgi:hypothetical protein